MAKRRGRPSDSQKTGRPASRERAATPPVLRHLAIVAIILVALYLVVQPHYLVPDSSSYLVYLHSILWDGDVDFDNDYQRFGMVENGVGGSELAARTDTGKRGNPFGLGSAFLWLPFAIVIALVAKLGALFGAGIATDGFGSSTLWAAHFGTWTYLLVSIALVIRTIKEFFSKSSPGARSAAMLGAYLGTPLIYYVLQMPSFSHACSVFVTSVLLYLGVRWRGDWTTRRAMILGAVVGLMALVRTQGVVFWVFPLILGWRGGVRDVTKEQLSLVGVYTASAFVVFLPQIVVWTIIYGAPWHLPQGEGFLHLGMDRLKDVLFSTRHGLFTWSPLFVLALAGWVMWLRKPETRRLVIAILGVFVLQWIMNSLPNDWWAGWSFGMRRFVDLVPFVVLGLLAFCRLGWIAQGSVYIVTALNLIQWLRISTGGITGETDPGWGALWGSGLWGSLSRVPQAFWVMIRVSPTDLEVFRRPSAVPPTLQSDPSLFFDLLFIVWALLILFAAYKTHRWWGKTESTQES